MSTNIVEIPTGPAYERDNRRLIGGAAVLAVALGGYLLLTQTGLGLEADAAYWRYVGEAFPSMKATAIAHLQSLLKQAQKANDTSAETTIQDAITALQSGQTLNQGNPLSPGGGSSSSSKSGSSSSSKSRSAHTSHSSSSSGSSSSSSSTSNVQSAPKVPFTRYTVQSGDTLSSIAQRYLGNATYWPIIYCANTAAISNPNAIEPGQLLLIPLSRSVAASVAQRYYQTGQCS